MTWVIYAAIAVITGSFINILQRVLMKKEDSDPLTYTIALQLFAALICFIFAFIKGFEMPPIREYPFNFFMEALLYSFITLFTFKALRFIEASKTTIIFSFGTVITIIASALFINETLTSQRLLGTFLIIVSIALVSKLKDFSAKGKGAIYALIAATLGGLALVNDTYLLRFSDSVSYTAIAFLLPGILLSLIYPNSFKKLKIFLNPKLGMNIFLLSFVLSVSAIALYLAIEKGALASQISPFFQSRVILTILLSAILLNEKDNLLVKILAAFLTVAGVMLIK